MAKALPPKSLKKVKAAIADLMQQVEGTESDDAGVVRSISVALDESIVGQDYLGGYIEIQPDSWDGEVPATDGVTKTWGFPISLLPTERAKIKNAVFSGDGKNIMYIRFPLGFAYRGYRNIDVGTGLAKNIGERFLGQNATLKAWFDKISEAGGGLAPEYWCPAPYWVTSQSYSGDNELKAGGGYSAGITLASIKGTDTTQYDAQIDAFTDAVVDDLEYLHQNIAPVRMFGLQNEPKYNHQIYGACRYDAQTYNDVLEILYPKILASEILAVYNSEPNVVKLLVSSSDETEPFNGIASTFIASHADMIWGYTHHSMRKASGESYADGADWYKTEQFADIKGTKENVFINEYEYFNADFGTDEFRCSNNMLHLINEAVYGGAQVLHPVIHICKPLGQTLAATNTKGYCLFETNLSGEFGVSATHESNTYALNKGTATPNVTMYNAWAMFGDNLPVGAYLVGDYTTQIARAGWCAYKYNGRLYIFAANNSADDVSITITFSSEKNFDGKMYSNVYCGKKLKSKEGSEIEFVIPAYSGQVWIETERQEIVIPPPTVIVSDTFNRADDATGLGNAETGQTWAAELGVVGIRDNAAYAATLTNNSARSVIDCGIADAKITWVIKTVGAHATVRLVFRYQDINNELFITLQSAAYRLEKRVGGAWSSIENYAAIPTAGDTVEVILNGSRIRVFLNGTEIMNKTDTSFTDETKHGIAFYNGTSIGTIDSFKVETI